MTFWDSFNLPRIFSGGSSDFRACCFKLPWFFKIILKCCTLWRFFPCSLNFYKFFLTSSDISDFILLIIYPGVFWDSRIFSLLFKFPGLFFGYSEIFKEIFSCSYFFPSSRIFFLDLPTFQIFFGGFVNRPKMFPGVFWDSRIFSLLFRFVGLLLGRSGIFSEISPRWYFFPY